MVCTRSGSRPCLLGSNAAGYLVVNEFVTVIKDYWVVTIDGFPDIGVVLQTCPAVIDTSFIEVVRLQRLQTISRDYVFTGIELTDDKIS